jgi:predicted Zn-dependent peptidase
MNGGNVSSTGCCALLENSGVGSVVSGSFGNAMISAACDEAALLELALCSSGYFSEAEFSELLKKHWSSLPRKRGGGWLKAQDKQSQPRVKVAFKETEQAHIALGFKSFAYEDKRNSSLAVLAAVLGGGMSSRLWDEVREKRGLAYYVRASNVSYLDIGQFYITSGVQVGQVEQSVRVILQELERTVLESIGSKEVEKAKEYLKGKTALALEDNQVRLDWYLEQVAFKKRVESPTEIFKRINAVTASQIQAVAKMVFQKKMASLAIVGPYRQTAKFTKLLK